MSLLYIDTCFRSGSRTKQLADYYLSLYKNPCIETVKLGADTVLPLQQATLTTYCNAVAAHSFDDTMFAYAKQFALADEIVIAAPCWNFDMPSILHTYLELVCSQGVTFDLNKEGQYYTLCRAKKLTYITTAGGYLPKQDIAFSYIQLLCSSFFGIQTVSYYKAEALDIDGSDVQKILSDVKQQMKKDMATFN
ncbi:MAG: NAD(P)H-dependent oxidoreductase [Treponema sp.]|nr:NAD(P)H-dependent oxidoreductase [Treponema sp.]